MRLDRWALTVARAVLIGSAVLWSPARLVHAASHPAAPPHLQGTWTLDPAQSDDPAQRQDRGGGRDGVSGDLPRGMGRGGRGRGGARGRGGGERMSEADGGERARLVRAPRVLIVDQLDAEVHVSEDGAAPRVFALARSRKGSDAETPVLLGSPASYHGRKLEVEEALGAGQRLEQVYELSKDGRSLTVRTSLKGGGGASPTTRRLYLRGAGD